MPGVIQTVEVPFPLMDDSERLYPAKPAESNPAHAGEIICWGMAIFDGVKPLAFESHRRLAFALGRDKSWGDVWFAGIAERVPYPFAIFYALKSMFKTEEQTGKKADWFFWLDDDVVVPADAITKLRAVADPVERPFVAAVGYDRHWPFKPAVWTEEKIGETTAMRRMDDVPDSGVHKVTHTGLTAALFHRSLFDKVSEPWFAVVPGIITDNHEHVNGMNPDIWWCEQMKNSGLPVHICCDVDVYHLGEPLASGKNTAHIMRDLNRGNQKEPD